MDFLPYPNQRARGQLCPLFFWGLTNLTFLSLICHFDLFPRDQRTLHFSENWLTSHLYLSFCFSLGISKPTVYIYYFDFLSLRIGESCIYHFSSLSLRIREHFIYHFGCFSLRIGKPCVYHFSSLSLRIGEYCIYHFSSLSLRIGEPSVYIWHFGPLSLRISKPCIYHLGSLSLRFSCISCLLCSFEKYFDFVIALQCIQIGVLTV